jgi:hypothetical protein
MKLPYLYLFKYRSNNELEYYAKLIIYLCPKEDFKMIWKIISCLFISISRVHFRLRSLLRGGT